MDSSDVQSEISAQSNLVDSMPINPEVVNEIDRHIKEKEKQLNDRLAHIGARVRILDFLPSHPLSKTATEIDENVWNSLHFAKVWPRQNKMFEELSFDKSTKGFAFYYRSGRVIFDVGVVEDHGGLDMYYRIIEDHREILKLTGAPVEVKIWAFQFLRELLSEIGRRANNIASNLRN